MRRARLLPLLLLLTVPSSGTSPSGPLLPTPQPIARAPRVSTAPSVLGAVVAPVAEPESPWVADRVLVAPPAGVSLVDLARAVGAAVEADVGRSGWGVLRTSDPSAIDRLAALGASASREGRIVGAGKPSKATAAAPAPRVPDLWHLAALGLPTVDPGDLSGYVVAVLDSGVAYETDAGHVVATGLAAVPFVAPADLVELDGHPNDDHQHGTHIASLIASQGWVRGTAPGVGLMPIKVLDHQNRGTEWALVEGLHHAVDNGADVINLSLSFPLGYVPSPALQDALTRAADAGVVLVAAAGNDTATEITWPAASRLVIAVGATAPTNSSQQAATTYSNVGPRVDVLAPGGDLGTDRTGDGWVDGVLAETIEPGDPTRLGYWFHQGTSQATALVSGAAVRLLAQGVAPADIAATLQARGFRPRDSISAGMGAPKMDLARAVARPTAGREVLAGVIPWLAHANGSRLPRARVTVIDGAGAPIPSAEVVVTVSSVAVTRWVTCRTAADGRCDVSFAAPLAEDAWAFRVDTVELGDVAYRPAKALWASDGAEILLSALEASDLTYDALAVWWPGGTDPELGSTAPGYAIVDAGVGAATSPTALLLTESAVAASDVVFVPLDLDGSGLLSSPLGITTLRLVTFGGSGLLSSPLGLRTVRLASFDGSGLLSSPLGFHATRLYTGGSGLLSSPLGLVSAGTVVRLDTRATIGSSLDGTAFEAMIDDELGLRTDDGYEPGALVVASGAVEVGLYAASASEGAVPTPPVRWTP